MPISSWRIIARNILVRQRDRKRVIQPEGFSRERRVLPVRFLGMVGLTSAILGPLSADVLAQSSPTQIPSIAVTEGEADVAASPGDATLHYYLAIRKHASGDLAGALESLENVLKFGDGFMPITNEFFSGLAADARYIDLLQRFKVRSPRSSMAPVYHRFSDKTLLPEGVARDPMTGTVFVGSARGKITALLKGKAEQHFADVSRWPLSGLAVHPERRLLCAVSSNAMLDAARTSPINRITCFDIERRKPTAEYELPDAKGLNDLVIDQAGSFIYASDTGSGTIWKISVKDGNVERLLPEGSIRGVNGLAITGDGQFIYVAHRTGLARFEARTGDGFLKLGNATRDHVSAIDGLYFAGRDLIGVQSITTPGRVVQIRLSHDGREVADVTTLQSYHHPEFDQPTTGAVNGQSIIVLATTQIGRLQPDGTAQSAQTLKRSTLIEVPLSNQTVKN